MKHRRNVRGTPWAALFLLVPVLVAQAASTGSTSLLRVTGDDGGTGFGDYVSDAGALNSFYRFNVEVPAGTSSLQIDFFDADVGQAGAADDTGNRDRLRNAFNTTIAYRLRDPAGNLVATNYTQGTATQPPNSDNTWTNFFTRANPAAGHWVIEVDAGNGDDVNAFGLRAHDGDATAGGRELNVYANNQFQIGINPIAPGSRTSLFSYYPYVTHGCDVIADDFDYDSANANTTGGQQAEIFTNRSASFTSTFNNGVLSNNDVWNTESMLDPTTFPGGGPSGNQLSRNGYGIWPSSWRINEVDGENANFATLYVGPETIDGTPPSANPEANAFRVYFPTDGGVAPVKPHLTQYYSYASGQNPPAQNQNTFFDVSVVMTNPTPYAITFSNTNVITTRIGGPTGSANANANGLYVGGSASATQGTIISTPTALTAGLITWNPGTVASGATAILTFQVRVRPPNNDTSANRRFDGEGNGTANNDTHGTRATFTDETGQQSYTIDGICGLAFRVGTSAPVPVTVSSLAASRQGNSLHVEWTTSTETRNGGFDVLGHRADGSWTKLNAAPVPSKAADSVEEQEYSATFAAPADIDRVAIEDIALDGTRKRHTDVAVGASRGARAAAPIDWALVRSRLPARGTGAGSVYLEVARRGIHRVSVAALAAAGQDLASAPTSAIALRDPNGPVPVRIIGAAGATLGASAVLEFVGETRTSLYGTTNRYTLSVDAASARRPSVSALDAAQANRERDRWRAEVVRSNDTLYSLGALGDDPWYDSLLAASAGTPASNTYALDLPADATLEGASLALQVEGETEWPQADDHRLDIMVNGVAIARHEFDGRAAESVRYPLPPGALHAGANQVTLTLPADQGVPFDRVRVQGVSIRYDSSLQASDGRLDADLGEAGDTVPRAASNLMRDGFDDAPAGCAAIGCALLHVSGVSGQATAWQLGLDGTATLVFGQPGAQGLDLVLPRDGGRLLVAQEDRTLAPALVAAASPVADVPAGTDFVVIAHPAFAGSLGSFVTARQSEGLDVAVVTTEAIYARYSAGLADAAALRRFLADAYARGVRYALLVGGDTYDYANHLGLGATSFVPTMYTWTDADVRYAPSDALLGDVDDDGLPDVALGRWPARTTAEVDTIVAKTLAYATAPHAAKAVFAADNAEGVQFGQLNAYVADAMTATGWSVDQIVVASSDGAAERAALVAAINQGRALTHFVGHASVDRWTFEPLLLAGQLAASLTNATSPTIVAQWGCWSSYFVSPLTDSIANQFLFDTDGGAAAVIGAGTRIQSSDGDESLRTFMAGVGTGNERIGDAIDAMRRASPDGRRDLVYGINLLGDPTLKVRR